MRAWSQLVCFLMCCGAWEMCPRRTFLGVVGVKVVGSQSSLVDFSLIYREKVESVRGVSWLWFDGGWWGG